MSLESYRTVFLATSMSLIIIATLPTLGTVMSIPSNRERFSELWLLDAQHGAVNYPLNVRVDKIYGPVYLGVGNHMGYPEYYLIYVKFRNQTQQPPSGIASEPSPLLPLYEYRFFLKDGKTWETLLNFAIRDVSPQKDYILVDNISINGMTFLVNCPSTWDYENKGFYYQLFFELWIYNSANSEFQFHNRFVGMWLNMTV